MGLMVSVVAACSIGYGAGYLRRLNIVWVNQTLTRPVDPNLFVTVYRSPEFKTSTATNSVLKENYPFQAFILYKQQKCFPVSSYLCGSFMSLLFCKNNTTMTGPRLGNTAWICTRGLEREKCQS